MPRGRPRQDHPAYKHPLYPTWALMRRRCTSPKDSHYPNYGGRGITVCERWNDFRAFVADMGPKPSPAHTLEREDNDGNYDPFNTVWALPKVQQNNKRTSLAPITHDGKTLPLSEWAALHGIPYAVLWRRLRDGWTMERALTH
jgi:hypothetical protein